MLKGIDTVLNGEILLHLDRMGHSDLVAIVDDGDPCVLMDSGKEWNDVQREFVAASGLL